jgi:two-component system OmpR family response regulator
LRESLRSRLVATGAVVDVAADGEEGLHLGLEYPIDVAIIDLGLPRLPGLELIRRLRASERRFPILVLTARDGWQEKVQGLEAGADDYLAKPFATDELIARVEALGRRATGDIPTTKLTVGGLEMDLLGRTVHRDGQKIDLQPREFRLLEFLMRSAGRICGRMSIIEKVWDYDFDPGTNLVDVYIKRLREKIDEGFELKLLHTVRGIGYVIKESP